MKLKLNISVESILPTIREYTAVYNYVCSLGWSDKDCNGTSLHKKTYEYCRSSFNLPSQLAISARMRASESLKSALTAQKKLEKQKLLKKTKLKKERIISCPSSNQLAVTSDNKFYGGGHVRKISKRYKEIRQKLQSKGTASAKRHLKRLSGREQRFKTDVNHCIAKSIVKSVSSGSTLVLESLKNIRKKVKLRKKQRTELNSWAFFQLEKFIEYKAAANNIKVEYISPRYTSQRCSQCGHIAKTNRVSQCLFKCRQCSFQLNADLNASRNIRDKLSVGC